MKILDPSQSYTFSKIFELKISSRDLAEDFGYTLERTWLNLPSYEGELDQVNDLKSRLIEILPYFELANEASRREVLISPVVLDLVHYTKSEVRIEYAVKVTDQLQGYLDYLISKQKQLLVIEAQKEDLDYGFTQLFAELIALDKWQKDNSQTEFIGAVTTGKIWEFGRLHRASKHIEQGLNSYRVPDDLDPLMRILVQALTA